MPDRDASRSEAAPADRVGTLRGAGAHEVDARLLRDVAIAVCAVALAAASVALYVAGAHRNAQITQLRTHGMKVTATVETCTGLLGGSGSNAAGYVCTGALDVGGRRYVEIVPGNVNRRTGSQVGVVVARTDPTLISTPAAVASQHTSGRVFILPTILAAAFVLVGAGLVILRRRPRAAVVGVPDAQGSSGDSGPAP